MAARPVIEQRDRPEQRLATAADAAQIAELMRASVLALFPRVYTPEQTASAAIHIAHPDPILLEDGTYFVHEDVDGDIVACGGWSRRAKLYTGSGTQDDDLRMLDPAREAARVRAMFVRQDWTRHGLGRALLHASEEAAEREGFGELTLMATLPGVPLYTSFGFVEVQRAELPMPDGSSVAGVLMHRNIQSRR